MTARVDQLIRVLGELQNVSYEKPEAARAHQADAAEALRLVFHIGREGTSFTEQQKRTVATKLVAAIKPLQINIEGHGYEFQTKLETVILKKRSALQFLLDTYGSFPVQGETLTAVFKRVNLKETVGVLDNIISYHRNLSDSDDTHSDREFPGIPSSHTWWN